MDVYRLQTFDEYLAGNRYPGRGIVIGRTPDGKSAVSAYFIMGRSANSRNRIFVEEDDVLYTRPFDCSRVEDASLIIYAAQKQFQNKLIVTNGDQTDTIYKGLMQGKSFSQSLAERSFEPDSPNFTPRISGMLSFADHDFSYEMSILKSADAEGSACSRYFFSYPALRGEGHIIHTYVCDGAPLPSFQGEPVRVKIPDEIDACTDALWNALDPDHRISLYVRYTDLGSGAVKKRLVNANMEEAG